MHGRRTEGRGKQLRPLKLKISAWGPYPGEVCIDFEAVSEHGLFLITGATGAGKTTIFDALTYALYGMLSGDLRDRSTVRSDFAPADTPTFVELTAVHAGRTYVIRRNPYYLRPRKRRRADAEKTEYTPEREDAVMTFEDGSVLQGSREVSEKVGQLLQLSMLAQGRFTELITAPASQKTEIFREIFDTEYCDRFAGILKERALKLERELQTVRDTIAGDLHTLEEAEAGREPDSVSAADVRGRWKAAAAELGKEAAEAEALRKEKDTEYLAANAEFTAADTLKKSLDAAARARDQVQALEAMADRFRAKEDRLAEASKAADLQPLFLAMEQASENLQLVCSRRKAAEENLRRTGEALEKGRSVYGQRTQIDSCFDLQETLRGKRQQLEEAAKNRKGLEAALGAAQEKYMAAERAEKCARDRYETADKAYRDAVIGIAARMVQPGRPCPVCGSLEHPDVAQVAEGVPDEEALERYRKESEKARAELNAQFTAASTLRGSLAQAAAAEKAADGAAKEAEAALQSLQEAAPAAAAYAAAHEREKFRLAVSAYEKMQGSFAEGEKLLAERRQEEAERSAAADAAQRAFSSAAAEKGFADADAYRKAVLPSGERKQAENEVREYGEKRKAAQAVAAHLAEETKGRTAPDTDALKAKCAEKEAARAAAASRVASAEARGERLALAQKAWAAHEEERVPLEAEYGRVQKLSNITAGLNAKHLSFEQYVLSGYFEEILRAANLRLGSMTASRYTLYRVESVGDARRRDSLEIEVLDAYTGRKRPVRTLSGGEMFQVSLCLALGMSDIVQSGRGGIAIDALFIDEGFGSLDGEALDEACGTLRSMARGDRMIGIISHVAELADRIPSQIVVERTAAGSKVVVRP
jgi:exonuclease SbcC